MTNCLKGQLLVYFEENEIPKSLVRYTALEQVTCWCLRFGKETLKSRVFNMVAGAARISGPASWTYNPGTACGSSEPIPGL